MPGYGKMGLAGMLPILSNMGHSVYNLPTALVSNNFDYGKFSVLDTTAYMEETIRVWQTLGFQFDCLTTGYLASAAQPAEGGFSGGHRPHHGGRGQAVQRLHPADGG